MADTGTDVTEHRPHSIMERSNSERTRVAAFLRRFPDYADLPHEVLLQYADEQAGLDSDDAQEMQQQVGATPNRGWSDDL